MVFASVIMIASLAYWTISSKVKSKCLRSEWVSPQKLVYQNDNLETDAATIKFDEECGNFTEGKQNILIVNIAYSGEDNSTSGNCRSDITKIFTIG